ncbi:MAG: ChaN family lipoprotein, partial [Pseudomonadota bacterium]
MMKCVLLFGLAFLGPSVFAGEVYQVSDSANSSSYEELVASLEPGTILLLGEIHDHEGHHESHSRILNELIAQGRSFHVGMEFFYYPSQPLVDEYIFGELSEQAFLEAVGWGSLSFDFYRPKVLSPLETGGRTFAINAPRELTRSVAREGLENISSELRSLMPPNFEIGSEKYKERFREAVGGDHFPDELLENYFAAQSIWDDTMAWQSLQAIENHPGQDIYVVVVGDFHVAFDGGLPDRLRARGAQRVVTVSHADSTQMNKQDKLDWLAPHPSWGLRSDWV